MPVPLRRPHLGGKEQARPAAQGLVPEHFREERRAVIGVHRLGGTFLGPTVGHGEEPGGPGVAVIEVLVPRDGKAVCRRVARGHGHVPREVAHRRAVASTHAGVVAARDSDGVQGVAILEVVVVVATVAEIRSSVYDPLAAHQPPPDGVIDEGARPHGREGPGRRVGGGKPGLEGEGESGRGGALARPIADLLGNESEAREARGLLAEAVDVLGVGADHEGLRQVCPQALLDHGAKLLRRGARSEPRRIRVRLVHSP
mmetsp:Transcript_26370/g.77436  ORF Transcript_26370/g.77436 Transcript_26370/m.77436 type:complete len:257 (-) Transcript_26370:1530-2300(-)